MTKMTYSDAGVDYDNIDPFKLEAQFAARETAHNLKRFGFSEVAWSRGESCYLIDVGDFYLAQVEEGLGTKNLVADRFRELVSVASYVEKVADYSYYREIGQDTVAMIVNDMITSGALPVSVAMHLAAGSSEWFQDEKRRGELIDGFADACMLARCVWGPGETPTLRDIIFPERAVLSGSAVGIVKPKERLIAPENIQHGDAIIFLHSSGIHANGLTMARRIADNLPKGYLAMVDDERTYGDTLLEPTHIYVPFVEDCLDLGVDIHYAVNITGHGWRKLMRAKQSFTYVIERLPPQLPIFDFLQKHGPIDDYEAYSNFNMGAGFVLYVPEKDVEKILGLHRYPFGSVRAGYIEKSDKKKVVIRPKGLEYLSSTLSIR